ncbi:DUF2938 family protein [Aquimarina longa]|uniref:DUF2938 family protein n=1 Tax=Aquimarina longa TaxID=1080221 RepID=UPI000782CFE4|nr:DUF2938 family protein [Aquimarina longa]
MNTWKRTFILGIGATFLTDIWAILLRIFEIKSSGLLIIGNWVSNNLFNIDASTTQAWIIGWTTHYIIGIAFAFIFISIFKNDWFYSPKLPKSLLFGLITVIFPLFIGWPIIGFGVAFSKTPIQFTLVSKAIILHLVYGIGIYLTSILILKINHNKKIDNEQF